MQGSPGKDRFLQMNHSHPDHCPGCGYTVVGNPRAFLVEAILRANSLYNSSAISGVALFAPLIVTLKWKVSPPPPPPAAAAPPPPDAAGPAAAATGAARLVLAAAATSGPARWLGSGV